jgi:hypothetical protein
MEEAIHYSPASFPLSPSRAGERETILAPAPHQAAPARLETRDGAYELKFLLDEAQVAGVLAWAREHLPADPHAARAVDETYGVHSVYLDTDDLAVYRRRPGFQRSKFRLRRYGCEAAIYLEEKRKIRGWVSKVRTRISATELALLQEAVVPAEWGGAWFRQALEERQLRPCCQVSYRRLAREGLAEGEPVRLTIDRDISCAGASTLLPGRECEPWVPVPLTLLELKFRSGLPRLFKGLVRTFGLAPAAASKYRHAAEACGIGLPE